ncbi:Uncharacterised protein [Mycobacteroides abscessus subsp. massiliense]|nr:Uncharacterised protein [Mycobacteroides abscessus subsp. massiliense]
MSAPTPPRKYTIAASFPQIFQGSTATDRTAVMMPPVRNEMYFGATLEMS